MFAGNVKALLNDALAPLTYSWGFVELPFDDFKGPYLSWRRGIDDDVRVETLNTPLADALLRLQPLSMARHRKLVVETKGPWTACFDNGPRGGDPGSPIGAMCRRLRRRGVAVSCIPDTMPPGAGTGGMYGAVQFTLYAEHNTEWLNQERSVGAVRDKDKWYFGVAGKVQPFEQVERYSARKKRDRFTPEMLEDYCHALGIRLFDSDFYGPRGLLLVDDDPGNSKFEMFTLAQARRRIGILD